MVLLAGPNVCKKCGKIVERLYPPGGGICAGCMRENLSLEAALAASCSCMHEEIKDIFLGARLPCTRCQGEGKIFVQDGVSQGQDYGPEVYGHNEKCDHCGGIGKEPRKN